MAYTPYKQALPDTTLYERLQGNYTPNLGLKNPYDASLFSSQDYLDNKEDPFGYAKKKLGFGPTLDDTLGNKAAAVGLGGLFAPQASTGGDSANQENQRNYYADREAELRAANLPEERVQAILRAEQEENNARLAAGLTLFGNAVIPGATAFGLAKYGPVGYADYLQGNTRVLMGDKSGYNSPTYTPKPAGVAAPVVSGQTNYNTYSPDMIMNEGTPYVEIAPTFDYSPSDSSPTSYSPSDYSASIASTGESGFYI